MQSLDANVPSPPQHWKWLLQSLPRPPWEVLLQPLPSSHHRWPAQHSSWRSLSTSSFCLVSAVKQKAAHHPCSTPLGLPTEEGSVPPPPLSRGELAVCEKPGYLHDPGRWVWRTTACQAGEQLGRSPHTPCQGRPAVPCSLSSSTHHGHLLHQEPVVSKAWAAASAAWHLQFAPPRPPQVLTSSAAEVGSPRSLPPTGDLQRSSRTLPYGPIPT